MRSKKHLLNHLTAFLDEMGLPVPEKISLEHPKDKQHGDLATNACLLLARQTPHKPRELAQKIAEKLIAEDAAIEKAEAAGPGFLNVTFSPAFWQRTILDIQNRKAEFGASDQGNGQKVQIEYVSANPTGPLHIGHGRGAAFGDSLARLLRFSGYEVGTEYYLNDAGLQMRILGSSVWTRARQILHPDEDIPYPETYYQGEYIADLAREVLDLHPQLEQLPEEEAIEICLKYAGNAILQNIRDDLRIFRVQHEEWFSEKKLTESGAVEKAIGQLRASGLVYEKDGAIWLKTSDLGDDKDRVLKKSNGYYTYFASDIAYHFNKYERGFNRLIDVWGADHHGYVPRMRAAMQALGYDKTSFDIILIQLVNLLRNGVQIAMSTRAGEFIPLKTVLDEVGVDATRFIFLSRKNDSQLDFDLEIVKQQNMENPVYYVQYAHARICSLLRKAAERGVRLPERLTPEDLSPLVLPEEIALLQLLDAFPDTVEEAARTLAPHHISHYLQTLAGALHGYYSAVPILSAAERETVLARLALIASVGTVVKTGLELLGVTAPPSM